MGFERSNCVTLSSKEAEYVGIAEVCKDIIHVKQVLEFMKLKVEYPIIIHVDNVGAIYLSKKNGGKRTKHIDIRFHFIREYIQDNIVKIIFIKSEDNIVDVYTKTQMM